MATDQDSMREQCELDVWVSPFWFPHFLSKLFKGEKLLIQGPFGNLTGRRVARESPSQTGSFRQSQRAAFSVSNLKGCFLED